MSLLWTLVALLLTGAVVWWAPGTRWANGSLVFQPGDAPPVKEAAQRLLSEYRRHVLLALAAAVLALLGFRWQLGESYARRLTFTIFALVCGALTWRVQWKMRDIRIVHAQHREAYLVIDELEELPRWPWLAATTVLVLSAIYLASLWQSIPARFPVHWNLSTGNANGWSVRTIWGVYRPLLLGLGLVAALYSMVHVGRWSLRRQWQTWDEERRESELLRLRVMTFTSTWVAVGLSALGLWLPFAGQPNLLATLAALAAYLGGIAVIIVVCRPA
jgi:uncharacterized membrane protein